MAQTISLTTGQLPAGAPTLRAGDRVLLSGTIYTARDAAHKRIFALLDQGKEPPFPLKDAVIYYAGPTPGQQGMAVGACGPTTSRLTFSHNPPQNNKSPLLPTHRKKPPPFGRGPWFLSQGDYSLASLLRQLRQTYLSS